MLPTFILPLLILLFQIPLVLRELLVCAFAVTLPFFSLTVKLMVANLLDYKDLSAMDRLPSQLFTVMVYIFGTLDFLSLLSTGRIPLPRLRQWVILFLWVGGLVVVKGIFSMHRNAPILTRMR